MPVPKIYQRDAPFNASYDFNDIISGLAYQEFFLGTTYEGSTATTSYILSPDEFYSQDIETTLTIAAGFGSGFFAKHTEYDFETSVFNLSRITEGEFILAINGYLKKVAGANCQAYYIAKIYHYDGTTETLLDTVQSGNWNFSTLPKKLMTTKGTITKKVFTPNDLLRITLEIWAINTDTNAATLYLGTDPKNRTGTNMGAGEVTIGSILIPFNPDV